MTRETRIQGKDGETVVVQPAGLRTALVWLHVENGDIAASAWLTAEAATQLRDALDRLLRPRGTR